MYEVKLAKLEEKIKHLSPDMDYFNEEELLIIREENYLKKSIIYKIIENYKDYSIEYIENLKIEEEYINLFPQKILCYFLISYISNRIDSTLITHQELESNLLELENYGITKNEKNKLRKKLDESYNNFDFQSKKLYLTNEHLNEIIKYKKYNFLYNIDLFDLLDIDFFNNSIEYSNMLIDLEKEKEKYSDEYPDVFILLSSSETELNKFSIYALLFKLRDADDELSKRILDVIVTKIENGETIRKNLSNIYKDGIIVFKLKKYEKNNIIFNYLLNNRIDERLLFEINLNFEEQKQIFINFLYKIENYDNSFIEIISIINIIINKFSNHFSYDIYKDKDISFALIDTGIFFYLNSKGNLCDVYEDKIIENINKGKYDNLQLSVSFPLNNLSKIYNEISKKNKIEKITLETIYLSDEEYLIFETIIKNNENINVYSIYNLSGNDKIINILLKYNRLDLLKSLLPINEVISILNKNSNVLYEIKNNYVLFKEIFNDLNIEDSKEWREFINYFLDDKFTTKLIIDKINHQENVNEYYTKEFYYRARISISKIYNIDIDKLDVITNLFGYNLINYLNNPNIIKLFELSDDDLTKISNLFPNTKYTIDNLKDTYDSLKQYEFSKKFYKKINIFPTFLHAIEDKNIDIVNSCIEELSKYLTNDLIKKTISRYLKINIDENMTPPDFLNYLVYKIQSNENHTVFIDILHSLTDLYIRILREEYRESYKDSMFEELKIKFKYKQKSIESEIVKKALENAKSITFDWGTGSLFDYLSKKFEKLGFDEDLLNETISYYLYKKEPSIHSLNEIKKSIKLVIKSTKEKIIDFKGNCFNQLFNEVTIYDKPAESRIDREYYLEEQKCDIFRILSEIDFNIFKSTVLNNPEVYKSLLANMKKNKLHILPNELKPLLTNEYLSFSGDYQKLSDFMCVYAAIYKQEKSRRESLNLDTSNIVFKLDEIFKKYDVYSAVSSIYSLILTDKDANLIKENPGPNAVNKMRQKERLDNALELTKVLFQRTSVTVPPIVKNIYLKSQNGENKSLLVTVGNFTNSSNLTHGERTGACMRIGGVGDTLFDFCLKNPNGFHIRFNDPKTGEYISRVSGFRNGNTVFLNELRYSCNKEKYSDEDVVKSCKLIAEELIKESKNSTMPIDNVVIHKAYAMENSSLPLTNLQVDSIKEGLPHFYSDVSTSAIVLATSNNGNLVKLNFDKSKVPVYKPARDFPIEAYSMNSDIIGKINRVSATKLYLSGEIKEKIKPIVFDSDIIYAVVANDWYIYVDENNVIHKDIINNDDRAIKEQEEWLEKIEMRGIANAKNR